MSIFLKQTSSKTEKKIKNKNNPAPQNEMYPMHFEWEREREASEGMCAACTMAPLLMFVSKQQMHEKVNVVY